jgi:hypothetical protein
VSAKCFSSEFSYEVITVYKRKDIPFQKNILNTNFLKSPYIKMIEEIKMSHEKVEGSYGCRRKKWYLHRKFGKYLNYKRIYTLMKMAGIQSVTSREKLTLKHR